MNKKLIVPVLLAALLIPNLTVATEIQESIISVDASANSDVEPDTVKIKFYVENSGTNLADIKAKNDKTVNSAINEIKKKLKENESVKTIAFRVNNVYSYKEKIRIFQKYVVTNGFEVKLKDINKASDIIKIAMDNGVKRVDNLNFYIENTQKVCNDLMVEAANIAKTRANVVANAAGASILKVKSINPYCSLNENYVNRRVYANAMLAKSADDAMAEESETVESIEPGTISVRANVNIMYYLK